MHDGHAGAHVCEISENVGRQNHDASLAGKREKGIAQVDTGKRVHAAGGFIEQQYSWLMEECFGEDDPLHHPAGKGVAENGTLSSHSNMIQALPDPLRAIDSTESVTRCKMLEELEYLEVSDDGSQIRHVSDARMNGPRVVENIDTEGPNTSVGWLQQGGQYAYDAGFARTVRAYEPKQAPGWNVKTHPIDSGEVIVVHAQVLDNQPIVGRARCNRVWRRGRRHGGWIIVIRLKDRDQTGKPPLSG